MCTVAGSGVSAVSPSRRAGVGGRLLAHPAFAVVGRGRSPSVDWRGVEQRTGPTANGLPQSCRVEGTGGLTHGSDIGRRGLAGIEPAGGKRPGRSALPLSPGLNGEVGYSVVVCGVGQVRPLQAPERLRPAGLHRMYAFSVDPHRITKPATAGGVAGFFCGCLQGHFSQYVINLRDKSTNCKRLRGEFKLLLVRRVAVGGGLHPGP